jgi:Membrane bound O-acyl transferase family
MTVLAIRAIIWTFQHNPYFRIIHKSSRIPLTYSQALLDAADLCFNLRGIGWSWSRFPYVPVESPSFFPFLLHTLVSFIFHVVLCDVTHRFVQLLDPNTIAFPVGGSIFDPSFPPLQRYSRSTLVTFIAGFTIYAAIQAAYLLCTLFSLIFLCHSPSQWSPLFYHPWFSTSLSQFWSRRWHQLFREIFVSFGGDTLALFMGPVGSVLGAFFVSGILHTFGLWGMGRGGEFVKVTGFFMMMAVGILLERYWKNLTGSRVGGLLGRIWTLVWLLGWGNILVDAWSRKGLVGSVFFPHGSRPSDYILQWWIKS